MPRLLLTEREAALIAESRKQAQLMVQGLERALVIVKETYNQEPAPPTVDSFYVELNIALTNAIKELR